MIVYWHPGKSELAAIFLYGQHRRLWRIHGPAIVRAFGEVTGVPFRSGVRINVDGGWSNEQGSSGALAGFHGRKAISLRYASFNPTDSRVLSDIVHELGHRLLDQHGVQSITAAGDTWIFESHRQLFVFLVDVIAAAFGYDCADRIVGQIEAEYDDPNRSDQGPYSRAWRWARARSRERRRELTRRMFAEQLSVLPRN